MRNQVIRILAATAMLGMGCTSSCDPPADHGPFAEGVTGPLGTARPDATVEQNATFARGHEIALRQFARKDGLGPAFNVTSCASCHEKPTPGGGAGLYRNFFLAGQRTAQGAYFPTQSAGSMGGVIRLYQYAEGKPQRPPVQPDLNVVAQRNPIPFYGVGLIAALPESAILERADPDDQDHDGISGRANYDRGFVGRFGLKAQTVSIEGFIRGPLFNHLGVTTNPLSEEQRAALPVDSSSSGARGELDWLARELTRYGQAAAPDGPLVDDDGVPDPELSTGDLFDLVSFAMLMAAPHPEPLNDTTRRGLARFDRIGCNACHAPRLVGPQGPLPIYSDLLLHDLGEALADGIPMGAATGSEFRTQPLWGISAVGPYLHDGRASTLEEAILWHGGEGSAARDRFAALDQGQRTELIEFLLSLGGRDQASPGLIPPGTPIADAGDYGGPVRELGAEDREDFLAGRALFDREFGRSEGVGGPRMNGDSCRACHFEPVVGGAGPRSVNVVRHGILNALGQFVPPAVGTILHRNTTVAGSVNAPQENANVFELRQTPHLFGLGLIESIPASAILANEDPDDSKRPDGITGRASWTDGGRLGRFGWKAQVPTISEFVRDAAGAELGMTLPPDPGHTFGVLQDNDEVADPELSLAQAQLLTRYLQRLAPPPRQSPPDPAAAAQGEQLFTSVGCALCHLPSLPGADGPVPLYSDLLLHEVLPPMAPGIEDASANMREFRTAPLWGLSRTAPYLHDGRADTLDEAIRLHDGEAAGVRDRYLALSAADRLALLAFLETL